jgi:hypothetical protein
MQRFFWYLRHRIRVIHWYIKFKYKSPIIARHACLGSDVLKLLETKAKIVNVQKGRVDYILKCMKDSKFKSKSFKVVNHLKRSEILGCVIQEEVLFDWLRPKNPVALLMDSMAELADQEFQHKKDGWSFHASYSDINHTENFKNLFSSNGLLPIESLNEHFNNYFTMVRKLYPNIPIFYLHFPYKLENRQIFIDRALSIKKIIEAIADLDPLFFSISIPDELVDWDEFRSEEMLNFAYHYNQTTYSEFAKAIISTGHWPINIS